MVKKDDAGSLESLLLDLHLKRLETHEAAGLEDAVAHSPELAAQSQALRDVLSLLDRLETPEPPDNLVDSVMARVNSQNATIPFPQPAPALATGTTHELSSSPVLSLRELIAIAACITLFIGVFIPGYYKARSVASRNKCRHNLASLFNGMSLYTADNNGNLPSAGYVPDGSWLFTRQASVPRASNTRHFFLLLRNKNVNAREFLCPSAPDARPMLLADDYSDDYSEFHDFADPSNNSYSFIFMNRSQPTKLENMQGEETGRMPLGADRNPIFDNRTAHRINPYDDETFNSSVHDNGAGQNVLYPNGQAVWTSNPRVGAARDNIYRAGELTRYVGTELPSCSTDSFIVP